jgi:hypothetical protein
MRAWTIAAILLVAAEGVALACSCIAPGKPEEARATAREVVKEAVAIVEVQVLSGYDERWRKGERVEVRRTLFGRAPATFHVFRYGRPSSAACGLELKKGERRVLILYRPKRTPWFGSHYAVHNLCSDYLVRQPYLPVTLQEARRRR